jgi:hypothetical protein
VTRRRKLQLAAAAAVLLVGWATGLLALLVHLLWVLVLWAVGLTLLVVIAALPGLWDKLTH